VAARSRPMFARRRRSPVGTLIGAFVLLLVLPSLLAATPIDPWSGFGQVVGAGLTDARPDQAGAAWAQDAGEEPRELDREPDQEAAAPPTAPFATIDAVTLHLPAPAVVLVGFHEASSPESRALSPVGALQDHQNTTKFEPPTDVPDGPGYVVLSSRGRPYPATSAIDVVLDEDAAVRSPVSGVVTDVRGYHLYGRYADQRIEIAPVEAPEQRIVMIHLEDVTVSVGDEVVVGETVVAAGARVFPFGSHIDRYTEPTRYPHVHYEVKRAVREDAGT
jgi:murein DD-endopeptidase MepM/ murein hydrolase activator NlpD